MSHLFSMRVSTLLVICGVSYLLTAGKTIHACFASVRQDGRPHWLCVWYEAMLAVHLLFVCTVSNSVMENQGIVLLWLHPVLLRVEPLLWANVLIATLGGVCAFRLRRPWMAAESVLLACCTPPVIDAMGEGSSLLLIVDVSFFAARVLATLALDIRNSKTSVSRLSVIDALDALPEGVMWMNERREVLFMNDAMRASLTRLGLSTNLADARGLWGRLEGQAREVAVDQLLVDVDNETTCLFVRDKAVLRRTPCERVMAFDVTEEVAINARLESVNRLLEAANEELRASMQQVRKMSGGNLNSLLGMLPGGLGTRIGEVDVDEKAIKRIEAMITSMTPEERRKPQILNASRKRRIVKGSGSSIQELNRLLKQYEQMKTMMKQFTGKGSKRKMANMMSQFSRGKMPFGM